MPIFDTLKSIFAGAAAEPPSPSKLDSTSEATLSQSLGRLSLAGPGWITMQEARRPFSPMDDQYAFGEPDRCRRSVADALVIEGTKTLG
jgi:hypothetical protein